MNATYCADVMTNVLFHQFREERNFLEYQEKLALLNERAIGYLLSSTDKEGYQPLIALSVAFFEAESPPEIQGYQRRTTKFCGATVLVTMAVYKLGKNSLVGVKR